MKKPVATLVIVFLFVAVAKTNTSCATAESSQKHEVMVNISSPENRTYVTTSVSLSFDWTQYVNENEIPRWIGYSIDEHYIVTVGNSTSASSYNTQLTNLVDGVHTLKVYVSGSLQTLYSVDVQFTVDTTHPEGTVLEPRKWIDNQDNYPLMEPIEHIIDTGNEEPPEFLIWILLPVIIAAAVVAVLIYKKKLAKTPN
ncbi:MAG: hypothetical protein NWF03_04645 [Candidatus Bathyarchaeota archaeon]|nr:hypothetical protein [Candidatus Bathyarchaeota archaeon]